MQTIDRAARHFMNAARELGKAIKQANGIDPRMPGIGELAGLLVSAQHLQWKTVDLANKFSNEPTNAPKAKKTHRRRKAADPSSSASSEVIPSNDRNPLEPDRGPSAR